jgi:hypothetical protein
MFFVLCSGGGHRLSHWSDTIREQAPIAGIAQEDISIIASNHWQSKSVSRQAWDTVSRGTTSSSGVLVLSPNAWQSLLIHLPRPVFLDAGRVRFVVPLKDGTSAVGIKVERPRHNPKHVLGYLSWIRREAAFNAIS